ncbi:MAG: xanthine dehydrogenase family protein subunit M [Microscillaceae bacterium]|nr:xanthine dehydrogenase family protein subunit M [Microscillaceae bacterium]
MIPASFEYFNPQTLDEAISLLEQYGDDAKIMSGGHSLIPMMKLRLANPEYIIDINDIPGLSYIREEGGFLKIGALTREAELEHSELIKSKYHIFCDATKVIADPQVRNRGTIGGNLAHGDAANDHPAIMLAMNAQIVIQGPQGSRTVPMTDFMLGFYQTAIEHAEILTEIQIPIPPQGSGGAYLKLERKVGDYATAGVAVQVTIENNTFKKVGIGLTNVSPVPVKVTDAESHLTGKTISDQIIQEAAQMASDASSPSPDLRGSEEYKRAMVRVLTQRAIRRAIEDAQG